MIKLILNRRVIKNELSKIQTLRFASAQKKYDNVLSIISLVALLENKGAS
jgi:hypothetical protein